MRLKVIILTIWLAGTVMPMYGQCPDKDSLWTRMGIVQNSISLSLNEKLRELLRYEELMNSCAIEKDSVLARLLQRIGVAYYELTNYEMAVRYTEKSIDILRSNILKPSINIQYLGNCYYNLQIYYDSLKDESLREEAIDSVIAVDLKINSDYSNTHDLIEEKVKYLFNRGDYGLCLKYVNMGESLIRKYYPYDIKALRFLFTYKITSLYSSKDYALAEKLLVNKLEECIKAGDKVYTGITYSLMAFLEKHKGNYDLALNYFNNSYKSNLQGKYRKGCAESLSNMGVIYLDNLNEPTLALSYSHMALKYADVIDSVYILKNIAKIYARKKEFDSAFVMFQKAFDKILPGIDESKLIKTQFVRIVNDKIAEYVVGLVIDKADTYLAQFKTTEDRVALNKALLGYRNADQILNILKAAHIETDSKLSWRRNSFRIYERAIEASYASNDIPSAFYFFERGRAALLNDQLKEQYWIGEAEIQKQNLLKRTTLLLERKLENVGQDSEQYRIIQNDLMATSQELNKLREQVKKKNPLFYQAKMDTSNFDLASMRDRILKAKDAFVELFVGDSAVYSLILTRNKDYLVKIDKLKYDSLSQEFVQFLSDRSLLNSKYSDFRKVASELYDLIFLNVVLPPGRIIISPDGNTFPFEALIVGQQQGSPNYFIEKYAVSYTFSARFLLNEFDLNSSSQVGDFLGIAPIQYLDNFNLSPLLESDLSIKRLQANFRTSGELIAKQATRQRFLDEFYRYKIVQLYTHASDSGYHSEPEIYFADSILVLSDLIYAKRPATCLIVLSACETGKGKIFRGEGIFSFGRGFAAIGIPSSITNLWAVSDVATYRLTELFYKELASGLPIDIALQKAKLALIHNSDKNVQLPFYWAAPILVGQSDPIQIRKPIPWKYMAVGLLTAVAALGVWIRVNRKKAADNRRSKKAFA